MKSKRCDGLTVVTDKRIGVHFRLLESGHCLSTIFIEETVIKKLAKEITKDKRTGARYIHLSPDLSFFIG